MLVKDNSAAFEKSLKIDRKCWVIFTNILKKIYKNILIFFFLRKKNKKENPFCALGRVNHFHLKIIHDF